MTSSANNHLTELPLPTLGDRARVAHRDGLVQLLTEILDLRDLSPATVENLLYLALASVPQDDRDILIVNLVEAGYAVRADWTSPTAHAELVRAARAAVLRQEESLRAAYTIHVADGDSHDWHPAAGVCTGGYAVAGPISDRMAAALIHEHHNKGGA